MKDQAVQGCEKVLWEDMGGIQGVLLNSYCSSCKMQVFLEEVT